MLHTFVTKKASASPEKIAVVQGRTRITYGQLDRTITSFAAFLVKNGLEKGDRVGILSENCFEYIAAYLGVQKAGGIAVDINYQSSSREAAKIVFHCLPKFVVVEQRYGALLDESVSSSSSIKMVIWMPQRKKTPLSEFPSAPQVVSCTFADAVTENGDDVSFPELAPNDPAGIIYTSGTTGEPKGVVLSHDNFVSNAESIIAYLRLQEHDSIMVILPFCYSYGKSLLTTHLMVGGTLVLENSFMYPDVVLKKTIDEAVTGFAGVPSTFAILLNRSSLRTCRFPQLRYITQAGGAMPPQHAQELLNVLPGTEIYIMYGQTEAAPRLTYLEPSDVVRKAGSIGKAIPGVTIELLTHEGLPAETGEEGELVASGRNIMLGYWNNPVETGKVLKHGKLFTGDMARADAEGYLYIVGRRSDMIKSGAHRISPKEIEEVIVGLDAVHETAVIGTDDPILGQSIKAFVVLKPGRTLDAKALQRHCQARLASFKIPKEVEFVLELPKTNSGKVRRHLLKEGTPAGQQQHIGPTANL